MSAPFENIVQHLFHQPSLQSVTVDELKRIADESPSFGAAQYLLLKKMQETRDPGFNHQLQKTALYFNNPLWLQFLLQPAAYEMEELAVPAREQEHIAEPALTYHTEPSNGMPVQESIIHETVEEHEVTVTEHISQQETHEIAPASVVHEEIMHEEKTEEVPAPEEEQAPLQFRSVNTIIETPFSKDDILFEPYHTIDYFASQGIKLDKIEPKPTDKLGKQLKSFTEWLKMMKKLPQATIEKVLGENDESKVVTDAAKSIAEKEVITETMAEVFEMQGLRENAVEVYRKLSLLDPSKSAYFAAKIEALKH